MEEKLEGIFKKSRSCFRIVYVFASEQNFEFSYYLNFVPHYR